MGQGTIDAALGAGKYLVTVERDTIRADERLVALTTAITALDATTIPAVQAKFDAQDTATKSAIAMLNTAIDGADVEVIKAATKAANEAQEALTNVRRLLDLLKLKRQGYAADRDWLLANIPADEQAQIWCADYNTDLTGVSRLIYPENDPENTPVIYPGGVTGLGSEHIVADGYRQPAISSTPAGAWLNAALMPGWQKNIAPTYRVGTVTALNTVNDTASVTLSAATSRYQAIDINPSDVTLTAVPVEYMDCNAGAFKVGDAIIVEYQGNNLTNPRVIGFVTDPRTCAKPYVWFEYDTGTTEEHFALREAAGWTEQTSGETPPSSAGFYPHFRHYYFSAYSSYPVIYFSERPHRGLETMNAVDNHAGRKNDFYYQGVMYRSPPATTSGQTLHGVHGVGITTDTPNNTPWVIIASGKYYEEPDPGQTAYPVWIFAKPLDCADPDSTSLTTEMEEHATPSINSAWRELGKVELYATEASSYGYNRELPGCLGLWNFNASGTACMAAVWYEYVVAEIIPSTPETEAYKKNRSRVFEISIGGVGTVTPSVTIAEIDKGQGYRSYTRSGWPEYPDTADFSGHFTLVTSFCIAADYIGDTPSFITVEGGGTISFSGSSSSGVINEYEEDGYTYQDIEWDVSGSSSGTIEEKVKWDGLEIADFYLQGDNTTGSWHGITYHASSGQPGTYYVVNNTGSGNRMESNAYLLHADARFGLVSLLHHRIDTDITMQTPPEGFEIYPYINKAGNDTWTVKTVVGATELQNFDIVDNVLNYSDLGFEGQYTGTLFDGHRPTNISTKHFFGRWYDYQTFYTWLPYDEPTAHDNHYIQDRPINQARYLFELIEPGLGMELFTLAAPMAKDELLLCYVNYNTPAVSSSYGESGLYLNPAGTFTDDIGNTESSLNAMFGIAEFPDVKITDIHVELDV